MTLVTRALRTSIVLLAPAAALLPPRTAAGRA
jgi:hypothetical protein